MNVSFYIAKRYLRSKSDNNAINYISIIALIGIVLGTASLFVVLSGFAGLKDFTLQFSNFIDPDLKAFPVKGKSFTLSKEEKNKLDKLEGIAHYSKIIEERAVLSFQNKNYPVTLKGVDAHYPQVTKIDSLISIGHWLRPENNQIVVGSLISEALSFGVLDFSHPLTLYVPKPGKGQITSIKQALSSVNVVNVGEFAINENLDSNYVYCSIDLAHELLNFNVENITHLEFKLNPDASPVELISELQGILGNTVVIKKRVELNDALYKMLNTEYLAVYLIFTLVLIIAIFNIIGSLIMMILDKKPNLKTLFNLGASLKDIKNIFFIQGILMTILGGVLGIVIGLVLILNQLYGPEYLKIYITSRLSYPVAIRFWNVIIVFVTITVLGVISSKIAAFRITKTLVQDNA